uniref:HMG box domain-containing protein n=1 Tax=Ascaris lumbricoides TaxID=6252 RepID=A0A0M3I3R1_ASCLU
MATSAKRVMKAAVNWKQLTDKLTPQYVTELSALKVSRLSNTKTIVSFYSLISLPF